MKWTITWHFWHIIQHWEHLLTCDALSMILRLSRNHCTPEPATAIDPSRAYVHGESLPNCAATVVSRPCFDDTISLPVWNRRNEPVPYLNSDEGSDGSVDDEVIVPLSRWWLQYHYVFLAWPLSKQSCPTIADCWSPRHWKIEEWKFRSETEDY